ncbi:MAG: NrtA/SsuA/CpmA family ABC transporter substrate-binding protein [Candidatus Thiodiazotropha sp. (ex Ctena orbiculata)]|nr:NrtA/SsuA/CpmA family ABC transporter substrate-binding protein [Candidatus Thiodiazotropha taylori]MBT2995843.1 NrtA/SsuA/CpmA family ABC transporter substrate-binding protein [Candidatus Thiodiazotropha taylori]MBT2999158.1 NrtA/SsuA/CpmA family ABC transporter substrate-binding protein [Candidatus Thiodiazotropha taylori]MBV2105669.1 NrtA/SsuA/CpmA family ABC transporter substrate-binding protein [Candidatus Thiodiazotropha taylori]MBV2112262.1 NrtA/SsuA/CpmA family ABC transporter substr
MVFRNFKLMLGILILVLVVSGCGRVSEEESRVTLGQGMGVLNAPIFVTNKMNFWESQSLQVNVRPFVAGRLALDSLIAGDIDIATIGDTPVVYGLFKHPNLRIIATVMESNRDEKVIARRDAGIDSPDDLKGKRIGVFFGTAGEYYTIRFIEAQGLSKEDVSFINLKAPDMVAALSNGSIDAYVSWEPHVQNGLRALGDNAVVFVNPDIYTETWNLVTTVEFFNNSPETVRRVLRAVVRGVEYTNANRKEAIDITEEQLGLSRDVLDSIWDDYDFKVVLSENLVTTLKNQGEWIQASSDLSKGKSLPDYRQVIIDQPLREILPVAVSIP